ncbi:MAG: radical SAM protein, partial [Elusimicrobiota bacterium]
MWKDSHGRTARKLRVSVTDRCNLRCTYCMPAEPRWLPRENILSYEELARIVRVATASGVDSVRLTGGEPLLRRDLPKFVSMLRAVPDLRDLAMTTNGIFLEKNAQALLDAGLDRLTVSLDSLDPERYARLARRTGFEETLRGMDAAEAAGFGPLKVNVVVMRGINDDEIARLADWGRRKGRIMRFIEFMPLEGDRIWSRNRLVPAEEIVECIGARFPLIARPTEERSTA